MHINEIINRKTFLFFYNSTENRNERSRARAFHSIHLAGPEPASDGFINLLLLRTLLIESRCLHIVCTLYLCCATHTHSEMNKQNKPSGERKKRRTSKAATKRKPCRAEFMNKYVVVGCYCARMYACVDDFLLFFCSVFSAAIFSFLLLFCHLILYVYAHNHISFDLSFT